MRKNRRPEIARKRDNMTNCDICGAPQCGRAQRRLWELKGLNRPFDADRLPNGHTLVGQIGEVAEYDAKGKKIWSAKMTYASEVNRY